MVQPYHEGPIPAGRAGEIARPISSWKGAAQGGPFRTIVVLRGLSLTCEAQLSRTAILHLHRTQVQVSPLEPAMQQTYL
jgi:hypothetical protein